MSGESLFLGPMPLSMKPYKGTRDFYPRDKKFLRFLAEKFSNILNLYGYLEYDGPMLESFDLYAAKTGQEIVETQLYHFEDRGGRKVAIRPEMTPTLARMVSAKIDELPKPIRWFSFPNLWRYERPQRGRLREHWQLNVDLLGGVNPQSEIEILSVAAELLKSLKALPFVELRVNSRAFVNFVFEKQLSLDAKQALVLEKLIDAKAKMSEVEYLGKLADLKLTDTVVEKVELYSRMGLEEALKVFACPEIEALSSVIQQINSQYGANLAVFDPTIMRGLDYYTGMVFEAFDKSPDNPRAMFGGGRYDNLVGLFHEKKQLSGVGFGMGDVVLSQFLETHGLMPDLGQDLDVYVAYQSDDFQSSAQKISIQLREKHFLSVVVSQEAQKIKSAFKSANRLDSTSVILLSEDEFSRNCFVWKNLSSGEQIELPIEGFLAQSSFKSALEKLKKS